MKANIDRWDEYWRIAQHGPGKLWLTRDMADDKSVKKLNVACGGIIGMPEKGWTNLDLGEGKHILQHDLLDLPLPFDDGTFDYILMRHIMEHIPHLVQGYPGEFMFHLLADLVRISKSNAIWEIHGPDPKDVRQSLLFLGHTRLIGPISFKGICKDIDASSIELKIFLGNGHLERVDHTFKKCPAYYVWNLGGRINDWHLRRYLGYRLGEFLTKILGRPYVIRMVFRVVDRGDEQ